MRIAAGEAAQTLLAQGVPTEEVEIAEKRAGEYVCVLYLRLPLADMRADLTPCPYPSRFVLKGRVVPVDQHIGAPLRLTEDEEAAAVCFAPIDEHFRSQAD